MASLTQEKRRGRTLFRLQFLDHNRRRKSIRLGSLAKKDALAIAGKVAELVSCRIAGTSPRPSTAEWVAGLGDGLHEKLVTAGLLEPRKRSLTLGEFLALFFERHAESVGERTLKILGNAGRQLTRHFGDRKELRAITEGDAHAWKRSLSQGSRKLSAATIANATHRARQLFAAAAKAGYIETSPFANVAGGSMANAARKVYVDEQTVHRCLEAIADPEARLLVALARWGGLRTPSETSGLRWADILWSENRMVVSSPKTARHEGHASRIVPITPALRRFLDEAFAAAPEGAVYCVGSLANTGRRHHELLSQAQRKAGVDAWPKPYHSLRASFATDMARAFPAHVAAAWCGHSPTIAAKHYLTVAEADFAKAAGVVQGVVQQPTANAAREGQEPQPLPQETASLRETPDSCGKSEGPRDARRVPALSQKPRGFRGLLPEGGAGGGAIAPPELDLDELDAKLRELLTPAQRRDLARRLRGDR